MRKAVLSVFAMMCLCFPAARAQQPAHLDAAPVALPVSLPQIRKDGAPVTLNLAQLQGDKNLILFFFSEQCGVTYYYKARLQKMLRDFDNKGFVFVGVRCGKRQNPNASLDLAEAKYLSIPFGDDATGELTRTFAVRQSLTFAVLDKTGRLRYQGGFDDNVEAASVKKTPLRNALRDLAAGRPVALKSSHMLGCAIVAP